MISAITRCGLCPQGRRPTALDSRSCPVQSKFLQFAIATVNLSPQKTMQQCRRLAYRRKGEARDRIKRISLLYTPAKLLLGFLAISALQGWNANAQTHVTCI